MSKDTSTDAFHEAASIISATLDSIVNLNCSQTTFINNRIVLRPKSFFLSWNGVLCLMFHGFPVPLEQFKHTLNKKCNDNGYPKENFGSQWAKVTLAHVREDVPPLSLEEFGRLKQICIDASITFIQESCVPIHTVSLVQYEWRSLEKNIQTRHWNVPSKMPGTSGISIEQEAKMNKVYSEWDDETTYLAKFNAKGIPYRLALPKNGLTCVMFLDLESVPVISQAVSKLQARIEEEFQDRYVWMEEDSLHCTIRAMDR